MGGTGSAGLALVVLLAAYELGDLGRVDAVEGQVYLPGASIADGGSLATCRGSDAATLTRQDGGAGSRRGTQSAWSAAP
jgi:hypothetical protein